MAIAICRSFVPLFVAMLLLAGAESAIRAQEKPAPEQEFIAILQSDAPPANKALACKKLAVVGSEAAVPDLAKLLSDEHLASWARIALEAIPGAASDEALRTAAGSLDGKLLVGVVNSIGVRRDAGAVELLTGLMANSNPTVASSASVALGRIGGETATKTLRDALASAPDNVRSAVAEACVLCAEQALAAGRPAEAIAIYDQVRSAKVPQQRILEATRGAILARGDDGIPLLVEQLRGGDKKALRNRTDNGAGNSRQQDRYGPRVRAADNGAVPRSGTRCHDGRPTGDGRAVGHSGRRRQRTGPRASGGDLRPRPRRQCVVH